MLVLSGTTQIHLEHFGNVMPRQSVQDQKVLTLLCRNTSTRYVTVMLEFHLHHARFMFPFVRDCAVLIIPKGIYDGRPHRVQAPLSVPSKLRFLGG